MATHVINLDPLNPFSFINVRSVVEHLLSEYETRLSQFLVELAEIGQRAAQSAYGSPITVTVEETENGVSIRANGDAVVFLEFGAGSAVDGSNVFANTMPFPVRRGSFSDAKGVDARGNPRGSYARHNYEYWEFNGIQYTKVYPKNGMQRAYEAMLQDIRLLAARVFGDV